jgi:hypothetical protein
LKVTAGVEEIVHPAITTHAERLHLSGSNGSHRTEPPNLPTSLHRVADFGVPYRQSVVEDAVHDADDARFPAARLGQETL